MDPRFPNYPDISGKFSWDAIKPGYVPIYSTGNDMCSSSTPSKKGTLTSWLRPLHLPHIGNKVISPPIRLEHIPYCTKLNFIFQALTLIKQLSCNLDIAIVCSTLEMEQSLAQIMTLFNVEYMPISLVKPLNASIHGILVRFRKMNNMRPRYRMRVDHIIVYDPSIFLERERIKSYFTGVCCPEPQLVSLVCIFCPDIRICNYRDQHPNELNQPEDKLATFTQEQQCLLQCISYKKIKPEPKAKHNDYMAKQLVSWMILKDGSVFQPKGTYTVPTILQEDPSDAVIPIEPPVVVVTKSSKKRKKNELAMAKAKEKIEQEVRSSAKAKKQKKNATNQGNNMVGSIEVTKRELSDGSSGIGHSIVKLENTSNGPMDAIQNRAPITNSSLGSSTTTAHTIQSDTQNPIKPHNPIKNSSASTSDVKMDLDEKPNASTKGVDFEAALDQAHEDLMRALYGK